MLCQASYVPRNTAIAVAFRDNSILVWDSVSYNVRARLRLPEEHGDAAINCFTTTSDGQYLMAGTRSGSLLLWEVVSEVGGWIENFPLALASILLVCVSDAHACHCASP